MGNAAFRSAVNGELLPDAFRVVNDADVVARTPTGGYAHVGRMVLVNEEGEVWVEPWAAVGGAEGGEASETDDDGEQGQKPHPTGAANGDAAANGGGGGDGPGGARRKPKGTTLFAAEKELWKLFRTGAYLQHHLEDSYVASLRRCVQQQREKGTV